MVALHASGATGRQWAALADRLADLDVVAPDLHGHGGAPAWSGRPSAILDADVERVASVAFAGARRCHLVGHSYGGAVAIALARAYPGRVASVSVFEPVLFGVLAEAAPSAWSTVQAIADRIGRSLGAGDADGAARAFVDFWSGSGSWAALAPSRRAPLASRMPTIHAHFAALSASRGTVRALRGLEVPLLHLAGDRSPPPMPLLEALLRDALPRGTFEVMRAVGHMGPVTHAEAVCGRIECHLRAIVSDAGDARASRAAA